MRVTHNCLFLPKKKISCVEMQMNEGKKSKEDAEETVIVTGIDSVFHCNIAEMENFIAVAFENTPPEFKDHISKISLLICVTQSQTSRIPNLASYAQKIIGANKETLCLDIIDGCNGFVKSLRIADGLLEPGSSALIISGEINSPTVENSDISTKILFGDGLCFTIVNREFSTMPAKILNDGARGEFITAKFDSPCLKMNGFEVFRFTKSAVPNLVKSCPWIDFGSDSNLFILHQASKLVTDQISKQLGITGQSPEVFASRSIGNIASGSIPAWIAITAAHDFQNRLFHCVGYGAGLSWGVATIKSDLAINEVIYVDA